MVVLTANVMLKTEHRSCLDTAMSAAHTSGQVQRNRVSRDWHYVTKSVRKRIGDASYYTDIAESEFFRILRVVAHRYKKTVRHSVSKVTQSGNDVLVNKDGCVKCVTRRCHKIPVSSPEYLVYKENEVKLHVGSSLMSSDAFSENCLVEQLEIDWCDKGTTVVFEIKKYDDGTNYFCVFVKSVTDNVSKSIQILKDVMAS